MITVELIIDEAHWKVPVSTESSGRRLAEAGSAAVMRVGTGTRSHACGFFRSIAYENWVWRRESRSTEGCYRFMIRPHNNLLAERIVERGSGNNFRRQQNRGSFVGPLSMAALGLLLQPR